MTDGILLAEIQRDKLLRKYNAIIIDEAHERSLNIDFILGYLKRILPQRPDLKIIITSATIDPERFAKHFGSDEEPSPIIEVSGPDLPGGNPLPAAVPAGRRHRRRRWDGEGAAADDELEEDRDPLDAVCDAVDELALEAHGDILIFFSGEREIRDAAEALNARIQSNRRLAGTEVLPLFARLSLQEQHKVFHPGSKRRIVLATNVAETSLTVPGIKYVIDTGTARISRYSHRTKVQRLPIERVSQASANQRSGRCGRVSDGIAIRLYSEEDFESRPQFTDPEILRTNLAAVILQMTAMGVARGPKDVENFPFVEPPDSRAINDGVSLLRELGALTAARQEPTDDGGQRDGGQRRGSGRPGSGLTAVGQQLAQLPVDPRLGRMIVESGKRGCVREVMILAAALTIQDPRERPTDKQQLAAEKHARFRDENSDFTGYLNLWNYLQEKQQELSSTAFRRLCRNEFINYLRVREWQDLFAQLRQLARPLGISLDNKRLCRSGGQPRRHPHQPALGAAEPRRHPRRAQARVRRRPRQPLRDLPGFGTVQEVTHVRDGRRTRGDEPALGPRRGEVRSALGRTGGPRPGQAQLQRAALVQEDGRGDGPRKGHALRRAHHPAAGGSTTARWIRSSAASCSSAMPWWKATGRPTTSSSTATARCCTKSRSSRPGCGAATSWWTTRHCSSSTTPGSARRSSPSGTSTSGGRTPGRRIPRCSTSTSPC